MVFLKNLIANYVGCLPNVRVYVLRARNVFSMRSNTLQLMSCSAICEFFFEALQDRFYRHYVTTFCFQTSVHFPVLITCNFAFLLASLKTPEFWADYCDLHSENHAYPEIQNVYVRILWHDKLACSNFCIPDTWPKCLMSLYAPWSSWRLRSLKNGQDSRLTSLPMSKYQFYWPLLSLLDKSVCQSVVFLKPGFQYVRQASFCLLRSIMRSEILSCFVAKQDII